MKIAVISDIHGNIAALDAVLDDIATKSVDLTVNLGDICSGGLFPYETAERLIPLSLHTIKGNHERQLLAGKKLGLSDQYAVDTLSEEHIRWLEQLPDNLMIHPKIMMVHGTPYSDVEYLLETVTSNGVRPATEDEVVHRLGSTACEVILCGHTHIPRMMKLTSGQLIVNPGSVGLPAYDDDSPYPHTMESGSPHARYALISDDSAGWEVEFHKITYDWDRAAIDARNNGRDDLVIPLLEGIVF